MKADVTLKDWDKLTGELSDKHGDGACFEAFERIMSDWPPYDDLDIYDRTELFAAVAGAVAEARKAAWLDGARAGLEAGVRECESRANNYQRAAIRTQEIFAKEEAMDGASEGIRAIDTEALWRELGDGA